MGLEHRPYIGSWRLGQRKVVQHTPDALVYINGDISVPGCQKCSSKINIQKFVTSVSVDAGCDPAGAQASITLTVPTHHLDSFARDSQFILHPGLEVHVYMRGYFPVKGLYSGLDSPLGVEGQKIDPVTGRPVPDNHAAGFVVSGKGVVGETPANASEGLGTKNFPLTKFLNKANEQLSELTDDERAHLTELAQNLETQQQYMEYLSTQEATQGDFPGKTGPLQTQIIDGHSVKPPTKDGSPHVEHSAHFRGEAADYVYTYPTASGPKRVNQEVSWAAAQRLRRDGYMKSGGIGAYLRVTQNPGTPAGSESAKDYTPRRDWGGSANHYDVRGKNDNWVHYITPAGTIQNGTHLPPGMAELPGALPDPTKAPGLLKWDQQPKIEMAQQPVAVQPPQEVAAQAVQNPNWGPSMLEGMGLSNMDLENILAYPYYHTFHGVVIAVAHSWSAGAQQITLQCASMLHFWQYHQMSSNASYLGARPKNSKNRMSLLGHNFTGMHPYEIIYTLHHDTAGSAGGVAFALSQKTNQEARSPITGESLFSLNVRYWERRFNQREIKLRLHGMTGGLFNSAQATFLSKLKGTQITEILKNRYTGKARKGGSDILSRSQTLGLLTPVGPGLREKKADYLTGGLTFQDKEANPTAEINLAEMIAFVSNISQWGQVQLFESTYESKLDIAQKVCEVTGFEFYQDVDGDFVFKPPMYNLDTSGSRVYRLEDIDIISINFDEKEPQVTYMTCKGTPFKNVAGHGVEGEWGVQGQYIDYRLVAQFGWRPGNFEAAYFNDPRSMFFAAMNRLDVMNAPTKSASVTIPIRPELRPGYPIYIPYLDCFYYCNSFAHSFSAGGQCTTTLQLIGKRGKFYAPGDPAKVKRDPGSMSGGIDAIQLGYTAFPPTPLEVLDGEGRARLSGFPNVVMALDPTQINPVFFLVGSDIDDLDSEEALTGLLKMGVDLNILTVKDKGDPGPEYKMSADGSNVITFWYPKTGESQAMPADGKPIRAIAAEYSQWQESFTAAQSGTRAKQEDLQQRLSAAYSQQQFLEKAEREQKKSFQPDKDKNAALIQDLKAQLTKVAQDFESSKNVFEQQSVDASKAGGAAYFAVLIREIGSAFFKAAQFNSAYKDPNATTTLLDMLSDKKAGLTNANVPGTYRYYSASHPDKVHQGIPSFSLKKTDGRKSKETQTPFVGEAWQTVKVKTFVPTREIQIQQGGALPQAQLEDRTPIWGIRVLTARVHGGEFVPTSEIRELKFSPLQKTLTAPVNKSSEGSYTLEVGGTLTGKVLEQLRALVSRVSFQLDTPEDLFSTWLEGLNSDLQAAAAEANKVGSGAGASVKRLVLPTEFLVQSGGVWPASTALSMYQTADTEGNEELFDGSSMIGAIKIWEAAASWWSGELTSQIRALKDAWWLDTKSATSYEDGLERLTVFLKTLGSKYGTEPAKQRVTTTTRKPPEQPQVSFMPVFPVSDNQGYTVVGSARYGRDIEADPDGVFDVLVHQDPLSLLSHKELELFDSVIIRGEPYYEEQPVLDAQGQARKSATGAPITQKVKLSPDLANSAVQKQLLRSLRMHMTDQQILDFKLARATEDPTVLQLDMMNWITEKNKDGVHKIPLVNAGFSLAELSAGITAPTCSCKAAEADTLLEIAGREGFVGISNPGAQPGAPLPLALGNRGVDDVTRLLMESSMAASIDWGMSQEALRGAVPDQKPSSLIQSFKDLDNKFEAAARDREAAAKNFTAAVDAKDAADEKVKKAFGG